MDLQLTILMRQNNFHFKDVKCKVSLGTRFIFSKRKDVHISNAVQCAVFTLLYAFGFKASNPLDSFSNSILNMCIKIFAVSVNRNRIHTIYAYFCTLVTGSVTALL